MLEAKQLFETPEFIPEAPPSPRVKVKKANPLKQKMVIVSCVIVAFVVALLFAATHTKLTMNGARINQLKTEISSLQNTNERLKLEIATLNSPGRIETIAMDELGMVQPEITTIQYIACEEEAMDEEVQGVIASEPEANAKIQVQNGKTMHPALRAINKLVTDHIFEVRQVEASQL